MSEQALLETPFLGDLPSGAFVRRHAELITGGRKRGEPEYLDRVRRSGPRPHCGREDRSARGPCRDPYRPPRSRRIRACRAGRARSPPARGRGRASPRRRCRSRAHPDSLELLDLCDEEDHLEEVFDVRPLLGRDVDEHGVAAPVLWDDLIFGELLADALGVGTRLSTLFTATMIGTAAALAWSMASTVCGITPSSAATTSIDHVGAVCARVPRMAVKASWPGVSRKVTCSAAGGGHVVKRRCAA